MNKLFVIFAVGLLACSCAWPATDDATILPLKAGRFQQAVLMLPDSIERVSLESREDSEVILATGWSDFPVNWVPDLTHSQIATVVIWHYGSKGLAAEDREWWGLDADGKRIDETMAGPDGGTPPWGPGGLFEPHWGPDHHVMCLDNNVVVASVDPGLAEAVAKRWGVASNSRLMKAAVKLGVDWSSHEMVIVDWSVRRDRDATSLVDVACYAGERWRDITPLIRLRVLGVPPRESALVVGRAMGMEVDGNSPQVEANGTVVLEERGSPDSRDGEPTGLIFERMKFGMQLGINHTEIILRAR
jgi:hypothetical protein